MNLFREDKDLQIWNKFVQDYNLDEQQQQKFQQYFDLIIAENQKYNITAITSVQGIILDHFYDSLALIKLYDLDYKNSLIDVGSGGGFPGIPLMIVNPHITVHIVEVAGKKIHFLQMVQEKLALQNIIIHQEDWRTFLRTESQAADVVTARASLQLKELFRMFRPSSPLKNATLVYWASEKWVPTTQDTMYLNECLPYKVGQKNRNLCFFTQEEEA